MTHFRYPQKSSYPKHVFSLMAAICVACIAAPLVNAAEGGEPPIATKLSGKQVTGYVAIIWDDKQQILNMEMKQGDPGTLLVVTAQRDKAMEKIAWLKVRRDGTAGITLHSRKHKFPVLRPNDLIQVWDGKQMMAEGRLKVPK